MTVPAQWRGIFYAVSSVTKRRNILVDILLKVVCVLFIPWKENLSSAFLMESNILQLTWKGFYSRIVHQVFTHGTLQSYRAQHKK